MKKIYQTPGMVVVCLQHRTQLMQSSVRNVSNDEDVDYGGASSNNSSGNVRTRESSGVWDEEW